MDPITSIATVLSILDVTLRTTSALVKFANDNKNASVERKLLVEETLSLQSLLAALRVRFQGQRINSGLRDDCSKLLEQFHSACNDLATSLNIDPNTGDLKQESRFRSIRTSAKWTFTKTEVLTLLGRIGRLQDYAQTLLLNDQFTVMERLDNRQQEHQSRKLRATVLDWISPLQMSHVHRSISERPARGSGRWFLESDTFRRWSSGNLNLIWCPGIPGAGKTVIASLVVEHLRSLYPQETGSRNTGGAVIYLDHQDQQKPEHLLGSLLRQVLEELNEIPEPLQDLFNRRYVQDTSASADEIFEAIQDCSDQYRNIYFVVDALDECNEETRWALIEKLRDLNPKVHLLITSRDLESIREELWDFERLEIKANQTDVEMFIDQQILKNKHLKRIVQRNPGLRNDIKFGVINTAQDMFLLARLHVEALVDAAALSIGHVRIRLHALPATLPATYDGVLQRIETQEPVRRDIAFRTLKWVSYAMRPLGFRELQHALAIEPDMDTLNEEFLIEGQTITELCAGLIIINQRTSVVSLVHYTAKKYLEDVRAIRFPGFHAHITLSCATYLTLKAIRDAPVREIVHRFPLAGYAARYIGLHARQNPEETLEPSTLELICQMLSDPEKRKPFMSLLDGLELIRSGFYSSIDSTTSNVVDTAVGAFVTLNIQSTFDTDSTLLNAQPTESEADDSTFGEAPALGDRITEVTALHLAASMGLAKVASMLLEKTSDINAVDGTGKTALAVAMEKGFEKAVEFLIEQGAHVDLSHAHGQNVLLLAVERGWRSVIDAIALKTLSAVADHACVSSALNRLLVAACIGSDEELKALLTQCDVAHKAENRSIGSVALFLAVESERFHTVQALLDVGVDVNSRDNVGQTALHRATRRQSGALVNMLLKNGANLECKNDDGFTAWSANAHTLNENLLRILLEAGADPNTKGHAGVSELYGAASNGNVEYTKFLLKSGTDPSIKTRFGWAPLHWASHHGHYECVQILLRGGADVSAMSDAMTTPLDLALQASQIAIIDLLRKAGAKEGKYILEVLGNNDHAQAIGGVKESPQLGNRMRTRNQYDVPENADPFTKLLLAFDEPLHAELLFGQSIYPRNSCGKEKNCYVISRPINSAVKSINIHSADDWAKGVDYPLGAHWFSPERILYEITHITSDYQELELKPLTHEEGSGIIEMSYTFTGGWKVYRRMSGGKELLLRTTMDWTTFKAREYRWVAADGKVVGRSSFAGPPLMSIEAGLRRQTQDLLVSCWTALLWSETVAWKKQQSKLDSPI